MKKIFAVLLLFLPFSVRAVETSARNAILMDMDSNRILYSQKINEQKSVASISKIMTAILACESGKLDDKVTVGDEIKKAYGSGIYIQQGEVLTLRDLLLGLMLRSGNDAALAIANYVSKTVPDFVVAMNQKAQQIGMKNTIFNNPNGLDEEAGNYSTAYDMALLTAYAMKNEDYQKIVSTKKYTLKTNMNTYLWTNKHKLIMNYDYVTGGKTGFTKIAKRTLVTTAKKNNLNLVVVTLNDGNDWDDHIKLFDYGFSNFQNYTILKKGTVKPEDDYYKRYTLSIKKDISYALSDDEKDSISIKYELEKKRTLTDADTVGKVKLYLGDTVVREEPIYLEMKETKSKKTGFFHAIANWVKNLW